MTTPVYVSPFTGTVVTPTDVSYAALPFSSNQQLFWPSTVNGSQTVAARIIDCVASTSGLSIALPAADQGTLGADILFRNLGAFAFTITNSVGGASVSVPAGQSRYYYLIDNTSAAGVWNNVVFGVGTSVADAATLAGYGLTTVNGQLATTQNIVNITSTPSISDSNRAATYVWQSGAGTINLPSYASLSSGWFIGFRNNGTGQLIINPVTPSKIDGQISIIVNPGDSGFIFFDTSTNNFYTVGLTAPANVSFTAATYDVDSIVGNTFNLASYAPIIQTYIAQSGTRTQTLAVTLPAITQIYILVNNTNQIGYNITFKNEGSSQPALLLPAGTVLTVLSDGTNLYPLTQSSTGIFYAANGSAGVPAYSFNNDTTTGLFLKNIGILGLSAGGRDMIDVDNSDTVNPKVQSNVRFVATLIDGGQF
jgi:hypothetical protein